MLLLRRYSRVSDLNISKDQRKKHRPYYIVTLKSVLRRKYRLLVHIINNNRKNIYKILLNAMFLQCKN